jgi:hypothetical protein
MLNRNYIIFKRLKISVYLESSFVINQVYQAFTKLNYFDPGGNKL